MAKVTKSAYNTFAENLKVARGFVKLHGYVLGILTGGEELAAMFKGLVGLANQLLAPIGLTSDLLDSVMEGVIKEKVAPVLEEKSKELDEKKVEELEAMIKPELEVIMATVGEVKVAVERGLLQQALVVTVSALEVYLHDVTIEAVANNRFIERRFDSQLGEKFDYRMLLKAEHNTEKALGEAVANSYRFQDPKSVRRHLKTLMGGETPLDEPADLERLHLMLHYRNLIAHRAGIVDKHFKQVSSCKGAVGETVQISPEFVSECIEFARGIATLLQAGMEALKVRSAQSPNE